MAELVQVERENMSMRIYRQIRSALIDGQYRPGERLVISTLAKELGTSSTPVREAIFRLVSEQALEMKAATSIQVPILERSQLREIQTIRLFLEGAAAENAARIITDAQLEQLEKIQREFVEAAATDPKLASARNRDFHFAILDISALPTIRGVVENMWVMIGPMLQVFHTTVPRTQFTKSEHKHSEVLAALRNRDPDKARIALQEDIRWGRVLYDFGSEPKPKDAGA